jgi:hypothetical protein
MTSLLPSLQACKKCCRTTGYGIALCDVLGAGDDVPVLPEVVVAVVDVNLAVLLKAASPRARDGAALDRRRNILGFVLTNITSIFSFVK